MATLNFEGVEVQLSSKENINFSYQDNYLVLLCREFTGCIVLTPATDGELDGSRAPPEEESVSPQRAAPPAVPASPRPAALTSSSLVVSRAPAPAKDDDTDNQPVQDTDADAAKRERIALLRKMVSSKGPGNSVSSRRSASVDRIPRSPRASTSPPDNRRSIFESGAEPKRTVVKEEQFSFKPTINAHSKELLAAKGDSTGTPVYEALYQKKNDKERRRKRAQEEQLTREMADCTFQPNVNEVKRKGPRAREHYEDPNTSIVQRAESWSKRREAELKSKREEKARREREVCTFKPGIHGVDKGLLRSQTQNSPGYEEFIQRQVSARQAREELNKVPHVTGDGWTGKSTKAVGFSFHQRPSDRDEIRTQIKSLKKPTASGDAERGDEEYGLSKSESPGAVSSPEDEGRPTEAMDDSTGSHIPLHEIVAMQWYYVDKSKQQQGPMSVSALSKRWKDGLVHENSYVWTQGMVDWVKAKDMPDLLLVLTHS